MDPAKVWSKEIPPEKSAYLWSGAPHVYPGKKSRSKKPTVVELFCGCGGTSTGFELAGYRTVAGCDALRPAIESFRYNHPRATAILGDIKRVEPTAIQDVLGKSSLDVLIGGIPCQGFSLNNRKRIESDERNLMYLEFLRFVKVLRPRAIVVENVSGMRSVGDFVGDIEKSLSAAGGMVVKSKILHAPDYGVPQKRKRLVFVGVCGKEFDFASIRPTHGPSTTKPYVNIQDAIGDLPSLRSGESKATYRTAPLCEYQRLMRKKSTAELLNHQAPRHPESTIVRIRRTEPGKPMYPKYKQRIRLAWDALSPTQVSGGIRSQFQFGHPQDNRGLSIRERCRIQSFPDHFEIKGGLVQGRVQTGNAVPPLLAKAIAQALKDYL